MKRLIPLVATSFCLASAGLPAAREADASSAQAAIPPKAAHVTGAIGQVTLGPVFADRYLCVEHALELEYAGDALGVDCLLPGGVEINRSGFLKLYRTESS